MHANLRLQGISAIDLVRPLQNGRSQFDQIRDFLAQIFNASSENVAIFSVDAERKHPEVLRIYFALLGEARKSGTFLNGVLAEETELLGQVLGSDVTILQIGVNDCIFENCGDGCTNTLNSASHFAINAEEVALVGPRITAKLENRCQQDGAPSNCAPNPCFNRGLCHTMTQDIFCECRNPSVPGVGPLCQGRIRSFGGNGSFIWLDPIKPCRRLSVIFYFMTEQLGAVLLFNGAMLACHPANHYCAKDFLAFYLKSGALSVSLDLGGRENFTLSSSRNVSDGRWHKVEFEIVDKNLTLFVDGMNPVQRIVQDEFYQLNVNDPLQLGGLAKFEKASYSDILHALPSLDGCIRDVRINGIMQDLTEPSRSFNSRPGCSKTDAVCMAGASPYCANGLCVSSMHDAAPKCDCDLGFGGDRCNKTAKIVEHLDTASGCSAPSTCGATECACNSPNYSCRDLWIGPVCTCARNATPVFDSNGDWIGCGGPSPVVAMHGGGEYETVVIAVIGAVAIIVIIAAVAWAFCKYRRRREAGPAASSICEPVGKTGDDHLEGAGESDGTFDMNVLKVPILPANGTSSAESEFEDDLRHFAVESVGASVGTLSSLTDSTEDGDVNWLHVRSLIPSIGKSARGREENEEKETTV